jgi:hypothetical protein
MIKMNSPRVTAAYGPATLVDFKKITDANSEIRPTVTNRTNNCPELTLVFIDII